ncbi:MAG: response regulator, partial [Gemmataceae bacterium]
DILDLSKIESGTVSVEAEEVVLTNLRDMLTRSFRHEAESRHLSFDISIDPYLNRSIVTDAKRLQQVLKNLLSNAFKFTEHGGVRLNLSLSAGGWSAEHPVLAHAPAVVAFEVSDTGVGIPPEKQKIVFEAFQQADASTSRKYGGTGLGLAICRELANLLGGEIQLRSVPGRGSTFTLYLPTKYVGPTVAPRSASPEGTAAAARAIAVARKVEQAVDAIPDDRDAIQPGDSALLIVEDDPHYARIMLDLAHDQGFKVLVAQRGADALTLAADYRPAAISLDVFLPDMLGWSVLSQLKQNPETRHIPVQIVTLDEDRQHGLARGAFAYINKPATPDGLEQALLRIRNYAQARRKTLLVVEDDAGERLTITELLGHDDIDIIPVGTGQGALAILAERQVDCVVLDLRLPDMSGFELLEKFRDNPRLADLPVVVFTGRELSPDEDAQLHTLA